ncbi:hypothetical protein [Prevotella nigrescens]
MAEIIAQRTFTVRRAPKDGKPGDPGDKGEDALTLVITPNTFVFQTNNEGVIENLAQNKGKIRMFLGQTEVVPSSIEITPYNCYARIVGDNTLHFDGISPNQWSGKVEITATYKGQTRTAIAEFMVSAQKWNEAKFLANDQQFKSIIAQNKEDKQGMEIRMSTIEQNAVGIKLEVKKQTFGGVNLLKGASLRPLNLLSLQRPQYVTIVNYPSVAHFNNTYLSISRHGATHDEWNGCKFPVIKAIGGRTYTLSMFTRIYGSEQPYIEVKRSRSKDMSAPKNSYSNIPSTFGVWKQYTYTFDMEEEYNYLQIFIGLTRDGEAYMSEIQLEEGTKPTTWKDPDVVASMQRAGLDITLGRILATADTFRIVNSKGELTTVIDSNGQLVAGSLRTMDRGNGYMVIEGNQQSFYKSGIPHPMRWIGFTSEGWVERMYDETNALIWENGVNGQIFRQRPMWWENIATHVITSEYGYLDIFFSAHYTDAVARIFQSDRDEQTPVYKFHAPRDARGNIKALDLRTNIQETRDADGLLFRQKNIRQAKFSGIIRTDLIVPCTLTLSDGDHMTVEEREQQRKALEAAARFIRGQVDEIRNQFSLHNTYNVDVQIGTPLYRTQIAVYNEGRLTGEYYLYANAGNVNINNLNK